MTNKHVKYNFFYIANPSRDVRANVIQTLACAKALNSSSLEAVIIIPKRSEIIESLFKDINPTYVTGINFANFFALLKKRSRIWNYLESTILSFAIGFTLLKKYKRSSKVFYCREFTVSFWLSMFQRILNAKLISEFHGLETEIPTKATETWFQPIIRFSEKYLFKHTSAIASFTNTFSKKIEKMGYLKKTDKKIKIVPLGVDETLFLPENRNKCKKELHLDLKKTYITYAGLTLSYRNIEKVLNTVKNTTSKKVFFLILGGTPDEVENLIKLSKEMKIEDSIRFFGKLDHSLVSKYYGASDVLIIPGTWHNDFPPLKLFEYMSAGRKIICPNLPVFKEILGTNGIYFSGNDFADKIENVIKKNKKYEVMEKNIYSISKNYTFTKKAEVISMIASELV